jgi:DNA-binding NtrC family response regulator
MAEARLEGPGSTRKSINHSLPGNLGAPGSMSAKPRLLVVDDDPGIRETMADILDLEGFETDVVSSGEEALELCHRRQYGFVLLDMTMPGMDGLQTLYALKQFATTLRVIMITGYDGGLRAAQSASSQVEAVFQKPLDITACLRLLNGCV